MGFTNVPGGDNMKEFSVYAYHIYCPFVNKSGAPKNKFA